MLAIAACIAVYCFSGRQEAEGAAGKKPEQGDAFLIERHVSGDQLPDHAAKTLVGTGFKISLIKKLKDPSISVEERQKEIQKLAEIGDEASIKDLIAAGNEKIYMNRFAIEGLGQVRRPSKEEREMIAGYLKGKLNDSDALVVCASIRSLGKILGEDGIPIIAKAMNDNRKRADGHEDTVHIAAVEVLGAMSSERTVSVLAGELNRSGEKGWDMDYGSQIIAALASVGNAEAKKAAGAYAERLAAGAIPDDPMARKYCEDKISEARRAAGEEK